MRKQNKMGGKRRTKPQNKRFLMTDKRERKKTVRWTTKEDKKKGRTQKTEEEKTG